MRTWLVCFLSFAVSGCNDVLTVTNPDIVTPDVLTGAQGLGTRRAGAYGDFAIAYGGDGARVVSNSAVSSGHILASGLLADEFKDAGQFPAEDARRILNTDFDVTLFYARLHRAREAAEQTAAAYAAATGITGADAAIAEMNILAGYAHVFFAEDFCSGVPISHESASGDVEYGNPQTTQQLLTLAIAKFDAAITRAQAAGNAELGNVARVGRGRALLNQAQFAQAATAVSGVPTTLRYEIRYSSNTPRQNNTVFLGNNQVRWFSVVNREGTNGIDYLDAFTAGDPRTPFVIDPAGTFDRISGVQYNQRLYTSNNAPIPLATGIEARLIEAEAALQAGNFVQFDAIHNAIRATLNDPDVGPVSTAAMTAAQRVNFHFRERALWMWLTGHRLGDMRRLVRQYGRAAETVYPTGTYFKTTFPTYGTDTNLPVPLSETNNPNFTSCIDRNP